jgi:phospholipid/cholesterol/gamma-HCH transport system permease protein
MSARAAAEPLGRSRAAAEHFGRSVMLGAACVAACARPRRWAAATATEARRQLLDALPLTLLLSGLGGLLISQQTGYQFQGNLPLWVVGSIVASSLVTEVTPLFVGLSMIGMIGARVAAELGSMQISEQIDALEVIGRDPVELLVVPRVLAGAVIGVILMGLALGVSMIAGWLGAIMTTHATTADFWFGVRYYMRDFPSFFALIKGLAFGGAITFVACYAGLQATGGSRGVGRAVKSGVVGMLCAMVILDALIAPLLKVIRV